jgi:uroporphyrinogen decarboxylase
MSSRERYLATLRGDPLDRFFRYEHGPWPTTHERWLADGLPSNITWEQHCRMDPVARIMINSGYCDSPYHPKFEQITQQRTAEYHIYTDSDGILKKELAEHYDTSMPEFLRFPVSSRADWDVICQRLNPDDAAARITNVEHWAAQCADLTVPTVLPICGVYGHPRNLLGPENLAYLIYDDPALLEEILDNWRDLYVALLRELTRRVRVDVLLIWEDMCYKNGPLIDPAQFRRFMSPRYTAVIDAARACGVEGVLVDTDGDCHSMIPVFLDSGADSIMPFEVQAGMDVVRLRREFPTLAIMGGIDKRALAVDRAAIRAEVDRVLPHFVGHSRFFPTLDHTVPPDVSYDNFQYYLECVRRYE